LRSAIAVIMAILGTILVLSGAAALWASALNRPRLSGDPDPAPASGAGLGSTGAGVGSAGAGLGSAAGSGSSSGPGTGTVSEPTRIEKALDRISRVPAPDRLIIWGVVLLALSAVAAGAIQVAASASAGNQ
jgi:hypothetical protein